MAKLDDFPCLENNFRFDDVEHYVCVAPDGHEGEHNFVPSNELMVKLDTDTGVEFSVDEFTVQ